MRSRGTHSCRAGGIHRPTIFEPVRARHRDLDNGARGRSSLGARTPFGQNAAWSSVRVGSSRCNYSARCVASGPGARPSICRARANDVCWPSWPCTHRIPCAPSGWPTSSTLRRAHSERQPLLGMSKCDGAMADSTVHPKQRCIWTRHSRPRPDTFRSNEPLVRASVSRRMGVRGGRRRGVRRRGFGERWRSRRR